MARSADADGGEVGGEVPARRPWWGGLFFFLVIEPILVGANGAGGSL